MCLELFGAFIRHADLQWMKTDYFSAANVFVNKTGYPVFYKRISHLSASTIRSVPARIKTCQCFLSSFISVVIWFISITSFAKSRHLSVGLPRFSIPSTVICNIFLEASSLSRLCTYIGVNLSKRKKRDRADKKRKKRKLVFSPSAEWRNWYCSASSRRYMDLALATITRDILKQGLHSVRRTFATEMPKRIYADTRIGAFILHA